MQHPSNTVSFFSNLVRTLPKMVATISNVARKHERAAGWVAAACVHLWGHTAPQHRPASERKQGTGCAHPGELEVTCFRTAAFLPVVLLFWNSHCNAQASPWSSPLTTFFLLSLASGLVPEAVLYTCSLIQFPSSTFYYTYLFPTYSFSKAYCFNFIHTIPSGMSL